SIIALRAILALCSVVPLRAARVVAPLGLRLGTPLFVALVAGFGAVVLADIVFVDVSAAAHRLLLGLSSTAVEVIAVAAVAAVAAASASASSPAPSPAAAFAILAPGLSAVAAAERLPRRGRLAGAASFLVLRQVFIVGEMILPFGIAATAVFRQGANHDRPAHLCRLPAARGSARRRLRRRVFLL